MSLYNEISYTKFQLIEEIEDASDINNNKFKPGDLFLFGKNVIGQKYTKYPGDIITVYQVSQLGDSTCMYFPINYKIKEVNKNA